ncbi:ABC transporter ATP-binding protein [Candidatus Methanocrinis natronophilus]|uniref:ABC transporter ATP-binding protein n=1 Tax=Candidatus Methanocrinis natronophilus TaxID=3033396 RepID=A0ABT5X9S1_9EURY|nr:ABC transporter ATP-binding protein [Candidatus Methanocrinis natronophilus]MDF0591431.1 ABC transporter ATP-binding protein [Candidatus Methanocrinis natronophilus]
MTRASGGGTIADNAIEMVNLTKTFAAPRGIADLVHRRTAAGGVTPVDGVDLAVEEGEVFGLLGPNGAGKTTLIKILCTLVLPTAGAAKVNGYDVVKESGRVRESIGLVTTDERSFYWRLTGRQNLEFFGSLHNFSTDDGREMVEELLGVVDLKDAADVRFLNYSAGMKQRMAIARGLLNDPAVLFMDEPTRSLDPGAAESLRDFIRKEIVGSRGKTIFISTHNLAEAEELCGRVAIFDEGKIKVIGSPNELKASLGDGSKLSDVFLHYTGKRFEERGRAGAGATAPGFRPDRRGFPHRGGGLGRRRGGV